tara:strand:+ start:92 stop:286 length:195 start_codon:yes stop_codon:yes gene_type:complete
MVIGNVGINEKAWEGKTFQEFEKAFKGKLRASEIKAAFDKLPKAPKSEVKPQVKAKAKSRKRRK